LASLAPGAGINSEIIDCVLQHVVVEHEPFHAFTWHWSTLWTMIKNTNSTDKAWPFDISSSKILAPVLLLGSTFSQNHWVLLHADWEEKIIEILDPVNGHEQEKEVKMLEF